MSSIRSAIHAIEKEISTSESRLAQLEFALKALKSFGEHSEPVAKAPTAKKRAVATVGAVEVAAGADGEAVPVAVEEEAVAEAPKKKKKRGRKSGAEASSFPSTGSEFFFSILGERRKTMNDLVEGAARKLEVADEAGLKILRARITSWLYPGIKAGKIVAAGDKDKLKAYKRAA
jgi:hypothetical protein